jgi:predicted RNase H-like HicB family nuclease
MTEEDMLRETIDELRANLKDARAEISSLRGTLKVRDEDLEDARSRGDYWLDKYTEGKALVALDGGAPCE